MRVLVITPTPTHPATQGNRVRVAQIAGACKAGGDTVELLYYAMDGCDDDSLRMMRAAWDAVHLVPLAGYRPHRSSPDHWRLDDWVSPSLIAAARFLADTRDYDLVVANYVWCSASLDCFGDHVCKVIDTHDAFGDRHERAREAGMPAGWFYTSRQEEARGLDRAHLVLAIQADEAAYFRQITRTKVVTVEYAAPVQFRPGRTSASPIVAYLGSDNPWNVASMRIFDSVLADLVEHRPDSPAPRVLMFGGINRLVRDTRIVQRAGEIDNPADVYDMADLIVNPMVGGTGLKIKTVEALSYGLPVLSTRSGGAGLEAIHPDLLHDSIPAMSCRLLDLIEDTGTLPGLRRQMQHGYSMFADKALDALEDTLMTVRLCRPTANGAA